jgi:hypothetical protein
MLRWERQPSIVAGGRQWFVLRNSRGSKLGSVAYNSLDKAWRVETSDGSYTGLAPNPIKAQAMLERVVGVYETIDASMR